ncbi:prepilin-type N-terminal cleavage/methylation domain-containing protein [Hathewaya limosa]|uniref:Prepilin-type N-terminal cleavage/methylation domain-containing protein n=1 Tax=Hathewaya limosa TaxID=1536 RepID=A0ABU0JUT6_HATLI|nr:prepilin-type N-terminal cleavage/methylation domain-containing protein [Hathewaya limosa]
MKKGFTLIEVLISATLVLLSITMVNSLFIKQIKGYNTYLIRHNQERRVDEGINFIQMELRRSDGKIKVKNDTINMDCSNQKKKTIKKYKSKLVIYTGYTYKKGSTYNVLIDDIKDFHVGIKNGIYYLNVVMKGNKEYKKCIII